MHSEFQTIDQVMLWLAQRETDVEKSISPLTYSVTSSCCFVLWTKDLLNVEHDPWPSS